MTQFQVGATDRGRTDHRGPGRPSPAMSADVTLTGPAATDAPAPRVARGFPWAWMAGVSTAAAGGLHFAAAAQSVAAGNLVVGFFLVTAFRPDRSLSRSAPATGAPG